MCSTYEMRDNGNSPDAIAVDTAKMRKITEVLKIRETSEGIGSRVRRCIGNGTIRCLPPFVMCEYFTVNHIGYPTRPSRGGHKLQYIISGCLEVQYSHLDKIYISAGDVLSDMAGKGVMRSAKAYEPSLNGINPRKWPLKTQVPLKPDLPQEPATTYNTSQQQPDQNSRRLAMTNAVPEGGVPGGVPGGNYGINDPEHTPNSNDVMNSEMNDNENRSPTLFPLNKFTNYTKRNHVHGISVLFDIPEPQKRVDSIQVSVRSAEITTIGHLKGVKIKLLSGSMFGCKCPKTLESLPVTMIDCTVEQNTLFDLPIEPDCNAFLLVLDGTATMQEKTVHKNDYVEFKTSTKPNEGSEIDSNDSVIHISVPEGGLDCRFIYCTGKPLDQPIYRQGPFIDVSMDWIYQAFEDYTEKKNGFEEQKAQRPLDPMEPAPASTESFDSTQNPELSKQQQAPIPSNTWVAESAAIPPESQPLEERKDSCESAASAESASSAESATSTESATSAESNFSGGSEEGPFSGEMSKPGTNNKRPNSAA